MPSQNTGEGKYTILKRIAVGGMAEIYLAEALNIHGFRKKVVIKRMLPQFATNSVYVEMFLDEARLVAQLNHPSIIQVFDIGQDTEGVFFTMEYVEGHDASDILGTCLRKQRTLSLSEALAIAIPAAEGLHHAHDLRDDHNQLVNLIHRDVSPSNIIVTNTGRVKLLDFGVAKSKSQSRETTGVSLKGKFGYMSPEQCEGVTLDRRSDVFSFGVVLWELLVGRRLFGGGNEPAVLMRIMTEDAPAPSVMRPDLPSGVDAICMRTLARDRDQRYSTLQDLLVDLDQFMASNHVVVNSRTLTSLLEELFLDEQATQAMPSVSGLPLAPQAPMPSRVSPAQASSSPAQASSSPAQASSSPAQPHLAQLLPLHAHEGLANHSQKPSESRIQRAALPTMPRLAVPSSSLALDPTDLDVVPIKSRKGSFLGMFGVAALLTAGIALLSSSAEQAPRSEKQLDDLAETQGDAPIPLKAATAVSNGVVPTAPVASLDAGVAAGPPKTAGKPDVLEQSVTSDKMPVKLRVAKTKKGKRTRQPKPSRRQKSVKKPLDWDSNSPFAP